MSTWEDFLWIIQQPLFIGLVLLHLLTPLILKILRKFYSKSTQEKIKISEDNRENKIFKKGASIILYFINLMFFFLFLFLLYSYINEVKFTPSFISKSIYNFFLIPVILGMGIYYIFEKPILKKVLKEDFDKYIELQREICFTSDIENKLYKLINKYKLWFGLAIILIY